MPRTEEEMSTEYCDDDPDYAVWLPPKGKTDISSINIKFGTCNLVPGLRLLLILSTKRKANTFISIVNVTLLVIPSM